MSISCVSSCVYTPSTDEVEASISDQISCPWASTTSVNRIHAGTCGQGSCSAANELDLNHLAYLQALDEVNRSIEGTYQTGQAS